MRVDPSVITKTIDGKIVVFQPMRGEIRVLNETAGIIWKMLLKNEMPDHIVQRLLREFSVSEKTVREDVKRVVREYKKAGLLRQ